MLEIKKGRFYQDGDGKLVRVLSDKLPPFDLYVVMTNPDNPIIENMYFVRGDGYTEDEGRELIKDITCTMCDGKGQYLSRIGPDEAKRKKCQQCSNKGYW